MSSAAQAGKSKVDTTVQSAYPGSIRNKELVSKIQESLQDHGYGDSTLVATSLCCDEVNRDLDKYLTAAYGSNFSMGGLAGFAFGGVTSFGAMAHHIPDGGSCLVVYGPHVGIDSSGTIGKINRIGRKAPGPCCGSAAAAMNYCMEVKKGSLKASGIPNHPIDAQQTWVGKLLLPHSARLQRAKDSNQELPLALFDCQDELMKRIVNSACGEVSGDGKIALLGGIQINTPEGTSDYFLPKVFELRNREGDLVENLLHSLI